MSGLDYKHKWQGNFQKALKVYDEHSMEKLIYY